MSERKISEEIVELLPLTVRGGPPEFVRVRTISGEEYDVAPEVGLATEENQRLFWRTLQDEMTAGKRYAVKVGFLDNRIVPLPQGNLS